MAAKKVGSKKAAASKQQKVVEEEVEVEKPAEEEIKLDEAAPSSDEDSQESGAEAPAAAKKTKANRFAAAEAKDDADSDEDSEPRGVVYIGHLPKGFYEPQMKTFFSQFGTVTRIRASRSKKNAGLRGYAFIEFAEESVAKIVAETMDKYLLFEKQIVCHLVAKEKLHPGTFKNWQRGLKNLSHSRRRAAAGVYNDRPKIECDGESVPQQTKRQAVRRNAKEKKLASYLEELEVDFDVNEAGGDRVKAKNPRQQKRGTRPKKEKKEKAASKVAPTATASATEAPAVSEKAAKKAGQAAAAVAAKAAEAPAPVAEVKQAEQKRKADEPAEAPAAKKKAIAKKKAKKA